jgi:hypothetical protein
VSQEADSQSELLPLGNREMLKGELVPLKVSALLKTTLDLEVVAPR